MYASGRPLPKRSEPAAQSGQEVEIDNLKQIDQPHNQVSIIACFKMRVSAYLYPRFLTLIEQSFWCYDESV
jgi:hypothetical protein